MTLDVVEGRRSTRLGMWWRNHMPAGFNIFVLLFVFAPLVVVVGASFNEGEFTRFPPVGFSLDWYRAVIEDPAFRTSFFLSARIALITSLICVPLGLTASLAISRLKGSIGAALQFMALAPLVLPEVLLGLGLLTLLVAQMSIGLSAWTLTAGHVLVTLPFVVNIVSAALSQQDPNREAAARSLGATPSQAFFRVIFPGIRGSVTAAGLFVFILSFDNIAISLFLSVPGLVPLPIRMFQYVTYRYDPTIAAASTLLMVISALVFFMARRLVNLEQVYGAQPKEKA